MATSDRTRELAKKWFRTPGIDSEQESEWVELVTRLLDAFERETRLDEAKWWRLQIESRLHGMAFLKKDVGNIADAIEAKRIYDLLEQSEQPTPEVKK